MGAVGVEHASERTQQVLTSNVETPKARSACTTV